MLMGGAGDDVFVIDMESTGTRVLDFDPIAELFIFDWRSDDAQSPWQNEADILSGFIDYETGTRLTFGDEYLVDLVGLTRTQLDTGKFQFNDASWMF